MPTEKEIGKGAIRLVSVKRAGGGEVQINPASVEYILNQGEGIYPVVGLVSGMTFQLDEPFEDLRARLVYISPGSPPEL